MPRFLGRGGRRMNRNGWVLVGLVCCTAATLTELALYQPAPRPAYKRFPVSLPIDPTQLPRRADSAINADSVKMVRQGATVQEVEAILGGEPRNEMTGSVEIGPDAAYFLGWISLVPFDYQRAKFWTTDDLLVRVEFDSWGYVEHVESMSLCLWTGDHLAPPGLAAPASER